MNASKLPGSEAVRLGSGDADLTVMIAVHDALRRDAAALARAAQEQGRNNPDRQRSVAAGWKVFKRQLHLHHSAEDDLVWPALRQRLGDNANALSVLDEMEAEHKRIDPLLAAVDAGFASAARPGAEPGAGRLGDAVEGLVATLTGHLAHEEKDGLPLIGEALTAAEWSRFGFKTFLHYGVRGGELFPWILTGASAERVHAITAELPPPMKMLNKAVWRPRFEKTKRW